VNLLSLKIKNILKKPEDICLFMGILVIPCLILGPFLPDLFVVIISLFFICQINNKKINIFKNNYTIFFILFYVLIISSSLLSGYWEGSLKSSLTFIRFLFFGFALHWIISSNEKLFFENLQKVIFLIIGLLFIDSIIQFFFHQNLIGMRVVDTGGAYVRVTSFFGDEQILGSYIARCTPIFLYIFLNNKLNKTLIYIFLLILNIIVLLSGERTALGLILIVNILFLFKVIDFKKDYKILFIIIAIFLSILTINKNISDRILKYTIHQLTEDEIPYLYIKKKLDSFSFGNIKKPKFIFSKEHTAHYIKAFNIFLDNPYFGVGPKNFRNYCKKEKYQLPQEFIKKTNKNYGCATHPHNLIAQFLSETGIIGTLFYLASFVYILMNIFKEFFKKDDENIKIFILHVGLLINIFPFLPSGNFFNNWLSIILHFTIGLIIYAKSKDKKTF
jgi:O-antigen ligase